MMHINDWIFNRWFQGHILEEIFATLRNKQRLIFLCLEQYVEEKEEEKENCDSGEKSNACADTERNTLLLFFRIR